MAALRCYPGPAALVRRTAAAIHLAATSRNGHVQGTVPGTRPFAGRREAPGTVPGTVPWTRPRAPGQEASGSSITNVAPSPRVELAETLPSWASVTAATIESPRPTPPLDLAREASAR